jgi:hypothetical protein
VTALGSKTDYFDQGQSELWMPTGGNPACAYERALVEAVPGTGARPEYRRFVAYGGSAYALLVGIAIQGIRHTVVHLATGVVGSRRLDHAVSAVISAAPATRVPTLVAAAPQEIAAEADPVAITAQEQIDAIQDTLSLGISHIAEILGVARGTVHSWARGDTPIPRDRAVAQRLRDLRQIGLQWRAHSEQEIGRLLTAPLGDGEPSLYDLLRAASWDYARLERALMLLADRVEERRARPTRDEQLSTPASAPEVERHQLRSLVQRGRFYGR